MGVLVAGGTGALGAAVLAEMLDRGHAVTATWVTRAEAERLPGHDRLTLLEADLLDPAAAADAVTSVGELSAVIDLVGGFAMGPKVGDTDPADFEHMLRLNLMPAFNLAREAMPRMAGAGEGAFVCVSARAALEPFAGASGYITAKAALLAFVRALHAEYRDAGVRSNAVLPSVIDTPANREAMPGADHTKWVSPSDIAKVVCFLASDQAAVTSGAAVPVYGRA